MIDRFLKTQLIGAVAIIALATGGNAAFAKSDADSADAGVDAVSAPLAAERAALPLATLEQAEPTPVFEHVGTGVASWYGAAHAGKRTASGERFDPAGLTAAHRTLPFGARVRVTHEASGRSVIVRINDRGPFGHGRLIDVSEGAARELGLVRAGSGRVKLEVVTG